MTCLLTDLPTCKLLLRLYLQNLSGAGDHVQFSVHVLAKAVDGQTALVNNGRFPAAVRLLEDPPDSAAAKISHEIITVQAQKLLPPVYVTATDGAALGVVILKNGGHILSRIAVGRVAMIAFHAIPAEVLAAGGACCQPAHFFPGILPHVGDEQITCQPVEAKAPWVTQANSPYLWPGIGVVYKRVVGGDGVAAVSAVYIQPQDATQQRAWILPVAFRITLAAAVTHADVQIAIRAKGDHAAVMVGKWLGNGQQNLLTGGVSHVGIAADAVAGDVGVAVHVCVVDEEKAVFLVVGMKGQPQQPLLVAVGANRVLNIQKWCGQQFSILDDANGAGLLQNEEPVVIGVGEVERLN